MPWSPSDAKNHTHKVKSRHQAQVWADVANDALKRGHDEASAIRQASAVIARGHKRGNWRSGAK